jgi:hypothetical protein
LRCRLEAARALPVRPSKPGRRRRRGRESPARRGLKVYRSAVALFGLVFVGLGVALVVATALYGGGVGYLIGLLFVALGAGRLYLLRARRPQ